MSQSAVTVLITRRVRPGHGPAFEAAMDRMIQTARSFPGHLGGRVVRPGEDADDGFGLFHVIFAFDTDAHLRGWQQSEARAQGLEAVAPHIEGRQQVREVDGLGLWYAEPRDPQGPPGPAHAPPPRWKVAVVTWLGIFPTVLALFLTVGPLMADWPLVPRVLVITLLVVLIMTWLVAPRLTRWLKHWLHAAPHDA